MHREGEVHAPAEPQAQYTQAVVNRLLPVDTACLLAPCDLHDLSQNILAAAV